MQSNSEAQTRSLVSQYSRIPPFEYAASKWRVEVVRPYYEQQPKICEAIIGCTESLCSMVWGMIIASKASTGISECELKV